MASTKKRDGKQSANVLMRLLDVEQARGLCKRDKMVKQPDCKWAQRPDKIMLTLNVPNLDPAKADIKITETNFSFKTAEYELAFDFFGTVDSEKSSSKVGPRDVAFILFRKESGDYWDKLNKGAKIGTLKVDWDKWKDEDELNGNDDLDMSGFGGMGGGGMGGGFGGMGGGMGMGGMGGLGGMRGMGGPGGGMGGMDLSSMMGGMGGMGMDGPDSDDDDDAIPGLEDENGAKKEDIEEAD